MRTLVVYGGGSYMREISLQSGQAIGQALIAAGHTVTFFDPGDDTSFSLLRNMVLDTDVVFPVLHGQGGEDGRIQLVLESLGVPFVGSGSTASGNCFNKAVTLRAVHGAGIIAPVTDVIDYKMLKRHPLTKQPFVLKPNAEGSSVDTYMIRNPGSFKASLFEPAFLRHGTMLIEALIEGVEMTVGVLGSQALPVIEIVPPAGQEFDFNNKYNGATQEFCPPQSIPVGVQQQAANVALNVHRLMGCRHLSRSDMIWGKDGNIYFLEINTMPGMTGQSLFPKAALARGMAMPQLATALVEMAKV